MSAEPETQLGRWDLRRTRNRDTLPRGPSAQRHSEPPDPDAWARTPGGHAALTSRDAAARPEPAREDRATRAGTQEPAEPSGVAYAGPGGTGGEGAW